MTQTTSKSEVKQRRRQLRQQRRVRTVQALWRFGCMTGILGGVACVVNQPAWMISQPEQIRIQGNRYLTDATIRSILAIKYPKPIVELAPEQLTAKLVQQGAIISARIDRELFPPRLLVEIEDRPPVAQILREDGKTAFLDAIGNQIPIASYRATIQQTVPKLRVRLPQQGTCPNWAQLYPVVHRSPVLIDLIDCDNPQNIFLQTEVGKVRLGSLGDSQRLTSQIQKLDLLRDWRKQPHLPAVQYIDLENPLVPKLQLKQAETIIPKLSSSLIKI